MNGDRFVIYLIQDVVRLFTPFSPRAALAAILLVPFPLHAAGTVSRSIALKPFGRLNWVVLIGYLIALMLIGWWCSKKETSSETFFLGDRKIPWWAAGLSLFSTLLSAITYLAIPARAYATDWTLLPVNLCVVLIAPLIAFKYLPVLRRKNFTTVYEFLADQFDSSIQKFGSASFILFQLGRMGIVLLLPALALSAVTGINVYLGIALMGIMATIYTVMGGIEAVIWTDVLQTGVLLGGAVVALVMICNALDGGFGELVRIGSEAGKFHWLNLNTSLINDSIAVVLLGGLFSNALVPYSSDQAVVQRYLTTTSEATARRSLWLGAIMVVPATLLFLLVGSGLFVFFQEHPNALIPLDKADQIFPWYIASQMPAGIAGLVIAGVFAAAMSSLDSSMHSIATSVVTDWLKPRKPARAEAQWLRCARQITLATGLFGTLTAMLLAGVEIQYLWDFFLGLIGLIGGTLAGVMAVAVFMPNARTSHLWPAIIASLAALVYVKLFTKLNSLLLGFIGVAMVVLITTVISRVSPDHESRSPMDHSRR